MSDGTLGRFHLTKQVFPSYFSKEIVIAAGVHKELEPIISNDDEYILEKISC